MTMIRSSLRTTQIVTLDLVMRVAKRNMVEKKTFALSLSSAVLEVLGSIKFCHMMVEGETAKEVTKKIQSGLIVIPHASTVKAWDWDYAI
eukprot:CAMPEP_0168519560 /NCGR_PEP_ID=MMETSP0405-20121227/7396_1 /TAXON_ID=498012 /ORGANISM="Trichosphaerium sp, Strain Am-I-7 wt" /LENGTH=89 /DNA_ID=CAMNT_0008540137 /DNA_START=240 /DNA_END=509 /DNA_ORIENTATION=+